MGLMTVDGSEILHHLRLVVFPCLSRYANQSYIPLFKPTVGTAIST